MTPALDRQLSVPSFNTLQSSTGQAASKLSYPDSEGLQLSPYPGEGRDKETYRDFGGLQISPDPNEGRYKEVYRDSEGPQWVDGPDTRTDYEGAGVIDLYSPKSRPFHERWRAFKESRRRKWYLLGCLAVILVVIAVILGSVLGGRHPATTPPSPAAQSTFPSRLRSSQGTWNGTGIAVTPIVPQGTTKGTVRYGCWFQDYRGDLEFMLYDYNEDARNISYVDVLSVPLTAANGTGLATKFWPPSTIATNQTALQLVYVNAEGILADAFHVDPPYGIWQPGNLSKYNFPAPTDNRPTLFMTALLSVPSTQITLFAGGTDGQLHSYAYNHRTGIWGSQATFSFPGSWAYSGAFVGDVGSDAVGINRTLITADHAGTLRSYVQANQPGTFSSATLNDTFAGGSWSSAVVSNQTMLANSSLGILPDMGVNNQFWALYPTLEGTLGSQALLPRSTFSDLHFGLLGTDAAEFGAYNSSLASFRIIQGSAVVAGSIDTYPNSVVFYQDEGTSLAWITTKDSGNEAVRSGHLVSPQEGVWTFTYD